MGRRAKLAACFGADMQQIIILMILQLLFFSCSRHFLMMHKFLFAANFGAKMKRVAELKHLFFRPGKAGGRAFAHGGVLYFSYVGMV